MDPDPTKLYTTVGIKSFGNGLFRYLPTVGTELSKVKFFRLPSRCLLASNIQAWEGALAVASAVDATECIASTRFLPYVAIARVDLDFVLAYFMSSRGREALSAASPATAVRNKTLSRALFEATQIPLPPIEEQRRIAARLSEVDVVHAHVRNAPRGSSAAVEASMEQYLMSLQDAGWAKASIREVADVNPGRTRLSDDLPVLFVPMAAVDEREGRIARAEPRRVAEVAKGYKQFLRGDVIFARITPCMQNGKTAVFNPTEAYTAGYGSTEFHVLRPTHVSAEWLFCWLRRETFRTQAMTAFTGTAGQQRVPATFVEQAPILVPPNPRAESEACAHLQKLAALSLRLERAESVRRTVLDAIRPAVLNEVFSGRM